jgi:hypothetical protein
MIATKKLAPIQSKIERAKEHITTLQGTIQKYLDSNPYQVSTKRDADRKLVYYLSKVEPTPASFSLIAGDAIQNLRTALDHLTWQLFLIGTGGTRNDRGIYFPIVEDATAYSSKLVGLRRKGLRQDAIAIFNGIQPYKGGKDHALWVLNELNIRDKHRLLVTVGSYFQSMNIGAYMSAQMRKKSTFPVPKVDLYIKPADNLFPLETGKELFIDAVDAEVVKEIDFRFNIVLSETGIVEGAPLIETLNGFYDTVSKTILLFKGCLS